MKPLDDRKLNALVPDGSDADCAYLRRARQQLEEFRDLPIGLLCLLNALEGFDCLRHYDEKEYIQGYGQWYIYCLVRDKLSTTCPEFEH